MRSLTTFCLVLLSFGALAQHPEQGRKLALYSSVSALSFDSTMNTYHLTTSGGLHMKLHRSLVRIVGASAPNKKAVWRYHGEAVFYIETTRFDGQFWARPDVVNGMLLSNRKKH
jgi:hypothetical protein